MSLPQNPFISVVVPTWNGRRFIMDTLKSILDQTHRGLEVIVVDDESSDGTVALVTAFSDPRVRVIQQRNGGVSSARNVGVAQAHGSFIAFSDQDDIWHPRKLELQLQALAERPAGWLSCTAFRFWLPDKTGAYPDPQRLLGDQSGSELEQSLSGWAYHQMLLESHVLTSSALLRRDDALAIGQWDTSLEYGEDWDYWLRASRITQFATLKAPLVAYRQNPHQGSRKPRTENWSEKVLQKAIDQWGLCGPDGRAPDPREFRRRRAIDWNGFSAQHLAAGNRQRALNAAWKAVSLAPLNRGNWQLLIRAWIARDRSASG